MIKQLLLKAGERYLVTFQLAMTTLEDILAILSRPKCGANHSTGKDNHVTQVFTFGDFLHMHTLGDDVTICQYHCTGSIDDFTVLGQQINRAGHTGQTEELRMESRFKYYSMPKERELVNKYYFNPTDERPNEVSNESEAINYSADLGSITMQILFVFETLLILILFALVFEKYI